MLTWHPMLFSSTKSPSGTEPPSGQVASSAAISTRSASVSAPMFRSAVFFTRLGPLPQATFVLEAGEGNPVAIAVHPNGSCKLFELYGNETNMKLLAKEMAPLQRIGSQTCVTFSVDGSKFAAGGLDGHLRIMEWPSMRAILDEPRANKSVRDMEFRCCK